jgi:2-polyprenyl-6-methoxyphenol hydroxylase-like FAD-dependent oxidoreductase
MRVAIVGGGPAGLYLGLLLKTRRPQVTVEVYEQNPRGATYGFGIVIADRGLGRLRQAHPASCAAIEAASYATRNRLFRHREHTIFIEERAYGAAIARLRLLEILESFARDAGVTVHHEARIAELDTLGSADLVVGADGYNSVVRRAHAAAFGTRTSQLKNRLAWYGTRHHFAYPLLSFKVTERGHFVGVAYPYTENLSTFVVESVGDTWERAGLERLTDEQRVSLAHELFGEELEGDELLSNHSLWRALPMLSNERWYVDRHVLIGDALHSMHPSIGSGTRVAMEDAIALADALDARYPDLDEGLAAFEATRRPGKQKLLDANRRSYLWYEQVAEKMDRLDPVELVFDFLGRTGRISEERLNAEFPKFLARYRPRYAGRPG